MDVNPLFNFLRKYLREKLGNSILKKNKLTLFNKNEKIY